MTPQRLARLFALYAALLLAAAIVVHERVRLHAVDPASAVTVESAWRSGALVKRRVRPASEPPAQPAEGERVVDEAVVAEGGLSTAPWLLELGLVSGRDGVVAELEGKTAYVTADDLLAAQAYDRSTTLFDPSLGVGVHRAVVFALLADRLGVPAREVEARARLRRVRFERRVPGAAPLPRGAALSRADVEDGVREAARYLARVVDDGGRFRYLVAAPTGESIPGYNWPRHAGATFFLAQSAAILDDPDVRWAALRAAALLRDEKMTTCGEYACIADDEVADVGSSALALIAFTEIVRTGADGSYRPAVAALARFLRSMQRKDGELMHLYRRDGRMPLDVQFLYYTGEATLALARAHTITGDARDLEAATRALAHLVGPGWSFFGSRYYWNEEHWTCQAMAELWDRAPNEDALTFCLRWHAYQRRLQYGERESPFDADGAFGFGPFVTPRVTPASSRGEAAGATLAVLLHERRAGRDRHAVEIPLLEDELRRALAFVLRHQLGARQTTDHLFADPELVRGALPGSAVDLQLRIDYPQHAGSALVRWLELTDGS